MFLFYVRRAACDFMTMTFCAETGIIGTFMPFQKNAYCACTPTDLRAQFAFSIKCSQITNLIYNTNKKDATSCNMFRYETAFTCADSVTRNALHRMSELKQKTLVGVLLTDHIEYSQLSISLFSCILANPNIQSCCKEPLWWIRGEYGCNCFYFEIITAVMDTAALFVTQNEPLPSVEQAQDVIWLLRWIIEKAFPDWIDGTTAKLRKHYTLQDANKLYELCRAYAFYVLFCQADGSPNLAETPACIQNLSLVLRTIHKFGPSISVFIASEKKTALIDVAEDWARKAKIQVFKLCKSLFFSQGEFALALACTKTLVCMGDVESKSRLEAEQKDFNSIYQSLQQKPPPEDISEYILTEFRYKGKAFANGRVPINLPVLRIT